jgi:ribosomal protein S27AE
VNGRAYKNGRELGHGVYDDGHEQHVKPLGKRVPTCPWCGEDGNASFVGRHDGRYFCGCGSLFQGTEAEWRALAQHRRENAERRARGPLPVQHSEKPAHVIPLAERLKRKETE